jgi:type II secretory pathway component GspD/PulD (secretin)
MRRIMHFFSTASLTALLLALVLPMPSAQAVELQNEIIYSARATELAPVIAPMAAPEGGVTVYQDQLIIRSTPEKIVLIRDTLKKLDRPLKNLRVSVRYRQDQEESQRNIGADGRVRIENGDVSGRVNVQAQDRQRQSRRSNDYSITASEGSAVFIATGQEIPVLSIVQGNNINGGTVIGHPYVPVQSGMEVTPRLQPDGHVMLVIRFRQAEADHRGIINSASTETQIQASLGQWTALSQVTQSVEVSSSGLASQSQQQKSSRTPLEILVEEAP